MHSTGSDNTAVNSTTIPSPISSTTSNYDNMKRSTYVISNGKHFCHQAETANLEENQQNNDKSYGYTVHNGVFDQLSFFTEELLVSIKLQPDTFFQPQSNILQGFSIT